ncbi:MAG TPA: hypothetical protein VED22_08375, partial [Nitrososphaerales archaeon]|nr:hypothetical protein [Nitrososphaerales archaeon]
MAQRCVSLLPWRRLHRRGDWTRRASFWGLSSWLRGPIRGSTFSTAGAEFTRRSFATATGRSLAGGLTASQGAKGIRWPIRGQAATQVCSPRQGRVAYSVFDVRKLVCDDIGLKGDENRAKLGLSKKRKSRGRSKGGKGRSDIVYCSNCGASVPRDKAKRVTTRLNLVEP